MAAAGKAIANSSHKPLVRHGFCGRFQPSICAPPFAPPEPRRRFLTRLGNTAALFAAPGAFAEELIRTTEQTEGPFHPEKLPLDTANDLIIVNNALTPTTGEITWLSRRILNAKRGRNTNPSCFPEFLP